jgi:hypothetical protein
LFIYNQNIKNYKKQQQNQMLRNAGVDCSVISAEHKKYEGEDWLEPSGENLLVNHSQEITLRNNNVV